MEKDTWTPISRPKPAVSITELANASHTTLAQPALVWRPIHPEEPVPVRMLYLTPGSTTFISPEPIEPAELIEISLDADGPRLNFVVANYENLAGDAYRISAFRIFTRA